MSLHFLYNLLLVMKVNKGAPFCNIVNVRMGDNDVASPESR